jgi:DNA-binding NarL/FixJ family response regulator
MPRKAKVRRSKVVIVDDHPAIREALAFRISKLPEFEICGEAAEPAQALRIVEETDPDVAIVDISLKNGNGIDLIKRIKSRNDRIRILVWSMHGENMYAERALRAGALGYITKEQAMANMIEALSQVAAGKVYLSPAMTEKLLRRTVGTKTTPLERSPVEALSDRELDVFRLIGQGVKTAEIAKRLHLSQGTIWTYRDRIREKLGIRDGTELAHVATQWAIDAV